MFKQLVKQFEEMKAEMTKTLQDEVKEAFEEIFEAYPEINAVTWTQYTPYFNDGDECIFSVNEFSITDATDDAINDINYGEFYGEGDPPELLMTSYDDRDKKYQKIWDIETFSLSELGREFFKETFGNHVKVIATRGGIDVLEYYHD